MESDPEGLDKIMWLQRVAVGITSPASNGVRVGDILPNQLRHVANENISVVGGFVLRLDPVRLMQARARGERQLIEIKNRAYHAPAIGRFSCIRTAEALTRAVLLDLRLTKM